MKLPEVVIPLPAPIKLRQIEFKACEGGGINMLGLDGQNYENLSHNAAETTRWVSEAVFRLEK